MASSARVSQNSHASSATVSSLSWVLISMYWEGKERNHTLDNAVKQHRRGKISLPQRSSLCTPVFIFTSGSSALLGHLHCGLLIWMFPFATFNTLYSLYLGDFFFWRKWIKHDNTQRPSFSYDTKYGPDGYQACKALILRASLTLMTPTVNYTNKVSVSALTQEFWRS